MATLTTLANFGPTGLLMDGDGNLFGGAGNSIFKIAKTASGYAPFTILATFSTAQGKAINGRLVMDSAGNLFGTAADGGANLLGTVFELVKTGGTYASTPTVLAHLDAVSGGDTRGGLYMDAAGNLFGNTTRGGANNNHGTVFELVKTGGTYASTPTVLVNFNGPDGQRPEGKLIADAAGNLFGTTRTGGPTGKGVIFEIVKTGGTYASTPTILHDAGPTSLILDADGNLFGTTFDGGTNGKGTVFQIAKSGSTYASTPTILYNAGELGTAPTALAIDAAGNLYFTVSAGAGRVLKLTKSGSTYATTPSVVFNFSSYEGVSPDNLIFDADGNIFGATTSSGNRPGTVFELSDLNRPGRKAEADFNADGQADLLMQYNNGDIAIWKTNNLGFAGGALAGQPGPAWHVKSAADFDGDKKSDMVMQRDTGEIALWLMDSFDRTAAAVIADFGASWHVVTTAQIDFNTRSADIVLQNDDSSVAIMPTSGTTAGGKSLVLDKPGLDWKVKATGDLTGDGQDEIILQRDNGEIEFIQFNYLLSSNTFQISNPGTAWHVKAAGDFDADGKADLLLQHDDSSIAIWRMDGTNVLGTAALGTPGVAWHVQSVADYDNDRKMDIVLQRDTGEIAIWATDGFSRLGAPLIGNPGPLWNLVGPTGG